MVYKIYLLDCIIIIKAPTIAPTTTKKTSLLKEKSTLITLTIFCIIENSKSIDKCLFPNSNQISWKCNYNQVWTGQGLNHKRCTPEQYREVLTPYQNNIVFCNIRSSRYIVILIAIVCF